MRDLFNGCCRGIWRANCTTRQTSYPGLGGTDINYDNNNNEILLGNIYGPAKPEDSRTLVNKRLAAASPQDTWQWVSDRMNQRETNGIAPWRLSYRGTDCLVWSTLLLEGAVHHPCKSQMTSTRTTSETTGTVPVPERQNIRKLYFFCLATIKYEIRFYHNNADMGQDKDVGHASWISEDDRSGTAGGTRHAGKTEGKLDHHHLVGRDLHHPPPINSFNGSVSMP